MLSRLAFFARLRVLVQRVQRECLASMNVRQSKQRRCKGLAFPESDDGRCANVNSLAVVGRANEPTGRVVKAVDDRSVGDVVVAELGFELLARLRFDE